MRREELHEICRAVENGDVRLVQHEELLYTGRVTACQGSRLTVEAFGHPFEWHSAVCRKADGRGDPLGPASNV